MRALALSLIAIALGAAPVHADDGMDGNSILGIGFGGSSVVTGDLAQHFHGDGGGGRVRIGGRFARVGFEFGLAFSGLSSDLPGEQNTMMFVPGVSYYPVATPWFQLAGRAGLGYGGIEGIERRRQVACSAREECTTKDETTTDELPGYALDLGVVAQVHLGRRHGGRAIVWVDAGVQLARFQLDDGVVSGRIFQLTIGLAHGMAY